MAIQLSPGVITNEVDLTTTVGAVSTSAGAYAGEFSWGPVNSIKLITSEQDLINFGGTPTNEINNYVSFFTAANFLSYSNNLKLIRVANPLSNNAISAEVNSANTVHIANEDDYIHNHPVGSETKHGNFVARYPGDFGNSLKVSVCSSSAYFDEWDYKQYFSSPPSTSLFADMREAKNDEMHIIVIDEGGKFSGGFANTVLEVYPHVSKAENAKLDDGTNAYYVTKILEESKYIYVMNHLKSDWGTSAAPNKTFTAELNKTFSLSGGTTILATQSEYSLGLDMFSHQDEVDISLLLTGRYGDISTSLQMKAIDICKAGVGSSTTSARNDAITFVSPPLNRVTGTIDVSEITAWANALGGDSYAVADSGWKYQFDKYNNKYRYIPLNADIAGLCARTDNIRDPWWSPAGFNRGKILNAIKLSWNPNQAQRDELYQSNINPVVSFPGEGILLYGDKTMQRKPSAFDRINVRRLFIVLEKSISNAAKYSLFEFNDEFTRAQFVNLVEPFLRDVKGRRGIYDYRVVCDATNNTPQVIDTNRFVGDIYIKPARSINFIRLNFIAVGTGVQFTEIAG